LRAAAASFEDRQDLLGHKSGKITDYYSRLEVAELEGDMLKALSNGDSAKLAEKYCKLIHGRLA